MRYGTTETKNTHTAQILPSDIYRPDGNDDVAYYLNCPITGKSRLGRWLFWRAATLLGVGLCFCMAKCVYLRLLYPRARAEPDRVLLVYS